MSTDKLPSETNGNESFGLTDEEYQFLLDDIDQAVEEGNKKYGYGGRRKLEVLSVEQILRKDSGHYGVKGMIVGISC